MAKALAERAIRAAMLMRRRLGWRTVVAAINAQNRRSSGHAWKFRKFGDGGRVSLLAGRLWRRCKKNGGLGDPGE